jgi:hypothetical protein
MGVQEDGREPVALKPGDTLLIKSESHCAADFHRVHTCR